jgi:hypothetical protein
MERIRDEVKEYFYQTCLKATIKDNKEFTPEEAQNMRSCYLRMAKSYKIVEGVQNKDLKYPLKRIF